MTVSELLPALTDLNHADKLRVMQHLVAELVNEDDSLLTHGAAYPVWSPHTAFDAADALLAALAADEHSSH